MKSGKMILVGFLLTLAASQSWAADFKECKVKEDAHLSLFPVLADNFVPAGAVAVNQFGKNITKEEIIDNQPIFFLANGEKLAAYQWFYTPFNKVPHLSETYVSALAGGENAITTFRPVIGQPDKTIIRFGGDIQGLNLTLICE